MNYTLTLDIAVYKFKFDENPSVLLDLLSSSIMETSGNIFDQNYYYVDTNTRLVYRKERFNKGFDLPVELIVRDRRYTKEEIVQMCREEGVDIVEAKHIKVSCWHDEYPVHSKSVKEILVIVRKPVRQINNKEMQFGQLFEWSSPLMRVDDWLLQGGELVCENMEADRISIET